MANSNRRGMGKTHTIMLLLTSSCNLNCSYCYEPKRTPHRMDVATARRIITREADRLPADCDNVEIHFMGGEPLLEFITMRSVAEWVWQTDPCGRPTVCFAPTNGTLLDDNMRRWLTLNKTRMTLGLSFDGDPAMQDANRSGSAVRVDTAFFARTWPAQTVKMTLSPQTVAFLPCGVEWLHKAGFGNISADLAMGKRVDWTLPALAKLSDGLSQLSDFYMAHPDLKPFSMLSIDPRMADGCGNTGKACGCGETMVCADWDGEAYACHLFSPVALTPDQAAQARQDIDFRHHTDFVSPPCAACALWRMCGRCAGMNYICTGNVSQPSPMLCAATKLLFAANCRFALRRAAANHDEARIEDIRKIIRNITPKHTTSWTNTKRPTRNLNR